MDAAIRYRNETHLEIRKTLHDLVHQSAPVPEPTVGGFVPRVYIYWAQGFENAPPIVQACRRQLHRTIFNAEIVELDDSNLARFVDLPGYVHDKLRNNRTHFSNFVRCDLMTRHSGIWVDATCYLATSPASVSHLWLRSSDFNAYRRSPTDLYMLSNWFMMARQGSVITSAMLHYLCEYWRRHHDLLHYHTFHFLFEAVYNQHAAFRQSWDAGIKLDAYLPHEMQGMLARPFDGPTFERTLLLSMTHKLTYKLDPVPGAGTVYAHIIAQ